MAQVEKVSVSIPTDVMVWVRRVAAARGSGVSNVLGDLARAAQQAEEERSARVARVDAAIAELVGAPLRDEELAAGEDELRDLGLL